MDNIIVTYNVHHDIAFGLLIAQYFFFTGLSAGSFVISVIATMFGRTEYKPLGKIGAVLAPVLLIIAPLNLIFDLEQPLRFWHLFIYRNLSSAMTYGTFLLTIYPIECIIYAYFVFKGNTKWAKNMGMIGIPLAISVHGYTGFILALAKARVLWNTPLLPILFLISAMVSGIALVIIVAAARDWILARRSPSLAMAEVGHQSVATQRVAVAAAVGGSGGFPPLSSQETHLPELPALPDSPEPPAPSAHHSTGVGDKKLLFNLGKFMAGLIVLDLFLVFSDALVMLRHTEDAFAVVNLIRFGPTQFGVLFLGVEVFLGGLVPLFFINFPRTSKSLPVLITMCFFVLAGVYAMRYVLVVGGQWVPLS